MNFYCFFLFFRLFSSFVFLPFTFPFFHLSFPLVGKCQPNRLVDSSTHPIHCFGCAMLERRCCRRSRAKASRVELDRSIGWWAVEQRIDSLSSPLTFEMAETFLPLLDPSKQRHCHDSNRSSSLSSYNPTSSDSALTQSPLLWVIVVCLCVN